jgi:hypothetical protein
MRIDPLAELMTGQQRWTGIEATGRTVVPMETTGQIGYVQYSEITMVE